MKILGAEISLRPNFEFYLITLFLVLISISGHSFAPILLWAGWNLLMLPLGILLHRWNRQQEEKLKKDFPNDPWIQKKYGK